MTSLNHRVHHDPPDLPAIEDVIPINSYEDAMNTTIEWSGGRLFPLSTKRRKEACEYLLKRAKHFKVDPNPLWDEILQDPDKYDELAEDFQRGEF